MAKTAVADIIIPTLFEKYAIERTAELAAFGQCGIIESAPEFDAIASEGGRGKNHLSWTRSMRAPSRRSLSSIFS